MSIMYQDDISLHPLKISSLKQHDLFTKIRYNSNAAGDPLNTGLDSFRGFTLRSLINGHPRLLF